MKINNIDQYRELAAKVLKEDAAAVEVLLESMYKNGERSDAHLYESELYSLLAGGKRVRPALVLEFCRLFGGNTEDALPFAVAVEMIHTSSLIHDDLPCMDDDDLRRGRPTNHKVYGEAVALLAGDGMLMDAFGVVAGNTRVPPEVRADAVQLLSLASGSFGMVRGQIIDMFGETHALSEEELLTLHNNKTGALIRVSAQLGCLAAGYRKGSAEMTAAEHYADKIGLVFQIIDDLLDVTSSAEVMGKSVGGDATHHKNTYLTFHAIEEAEMIAERLTEEALDEISAFANAERLVALGAYLAVRKH